MLKWNLNPYPTNLHKALARICHADGDCKKNNYISNLGPVTCSAWRGGAAESLAPAQGQPGWRGRQRGSSCWSDPRLTEVQRPAADRSAGPSGLSSPPLYKKMCYKFKAVITIWIQEAKIDEI